MWVLRESFSRFCGVIVIIIVLTLGVRGLAYVGFGFGSCWFLVVCFFFLRFLYIFFCYFEKGYNVVDGEFGSEF